MSYFVKFVPYNLNTLHALINKTIKFSTVYEFNDFNELGYLTIYRKDTENKLAKEQRKLLLKYLSAKIGENPKFKSQIIENAYKAGHQDRAFLNKLEKALDIFL